MTRLDSTRTAAVDQGYFWQPLDTCPLGAKVQLLTIGNVAVYGKLDGKNRSGYRAWAPLPKVPNHLKD